MEKLFFSDPASGRNYSYSDLISDLNKSDCLHPKYLQTSDTYTVFVAYLRSLLFETHLVLLDSDFSEEEILQLVSDTAERVATQSCKLSSPIVDCNDLTQRLNQSRNAKIGFFTSGTTGLPKRVDHHMMTLARSVKRSPRHAGAVWAFAYNPTHIAGCQVFLQAVLNGNSIVNVFGLQRDAIYDSLEHHQVSHISATPTFYRMLMPVDRELESVQRVTFGGERMDVGLGIKLKEVFPKAKFLNVYASTEAGTILASEGDAFGIREGLEGYVKISENQLMLHKNLLGQFAGASSAERDQWYATGDIVEVVSSAPLRFKIIHRDNQMINVGGYKVNPEEVESALREIDGIEDARVYARENSVLGSMVCCDVVVSDKLSEKEIRQTLTQQLQSFKVPRLIQFVGSLEKTRSGKVKR